VQAELIFLRLFKFVTGEKMVDAQGLLTATIAWERAAFATEFVEVVHFPFFLELL